MEITTIIVLVIICVIVLSSVAGAIWFFTRVPDVDCEVSDWSKLSDLSHCGELNGYSTKTRQVIKPQSGYGAACPALTKSTDCTGCKVSEWSSWSDCKDGSSKRTRTVLKPSVGDGYPCPALVEDQKCADCKVSVWSPWTSCVQGTSTRARTIVSKNIANGDKCPVLSDKQDCKKPNTISLTIKGSTGNEVFSLYADDTLILDNQKLTSENKVFELPMKSNDPVNTITLALPVDNGDLTVSVFKLNGIDIMPNIKHDTIVEASRVKAIQSGLYAWAGKYTYSRTLDD